MNRLRAVQVSFHADVQRRSGNALLTAWPTLCDVAIAAREAGADVTVVQAAHADEMVSHDDVGFHFVADNAMSRQRVVQRVLSLDPELVHVQGFGHPLAMRHLVQALGDVPVLVQDHGGVLPSPWKTAAWRWAHRGVRGVAFTAREQAVPWQRAGIVRATTPVFEVLESSTHFTPGPRDAAGMSGDPCFLWTGHLDANKDPLALLDAFDVALEHLPSARLHCCFGSAPLREQVERRIARSPKLAAAVTLVGARPHEEMEHRFRAADFFVQMSHREGSGYSIIEALACGATPLVTDIPALRAIVGDAGALVPIGDVRGMAHAMIDFANRDRPALRRAARERFERMLSFDTVGRQITEAYARLARRPAVDQSRAVVMTA